MIALADGLLAGDVEQLFEAAIDEQESALGVLEINDGRGIIQDGLEPLFTLAQCLVCLGFGKRAGRQVVGQLLQALVALRELLIQLSQLGGPLDHALLEMDVESLQLVGIATALALRLAQFLLGPLQLAANQAGNACAD